MGRRHTEFIHSSDVAPEPLADRPFEGLSARVLSRDDETGAYTAIVEVPSGWSGDVSDAVEGRALELLALRGSFELAGRPLPAGTYAYVPARAPASALRAAEDGLLYAMVEDPLPEGSTVGDPVETIDTTEVRLRHATMEGVPPGLLIKPLRRDPDTGDRSWICHATPGWQEDRAEIHPTVEEALVLSGDSLLGEHGAMHAGDYFWRAPNVLHGPMFTRDGTTIMFRTKGGDLRVTWQPVPDWRDVVDAYRDRATFYRG